MPHSRTDTLTLADLRVWLDAIARCYGEDMALTFDTGRHQEMLISDAIIREEKGTRRIVFYRNRTHIEHRQET